MNTLPDADSFDLKMLAGQRFGTAHD
jgi:hypothetical protein